MRLVRHLPSLRESEVRNAFEGIWSTVATTLGIAVFVILIWMIAKSHAYMWGRVSTRYGRRERSSPSRATRLETIVIAERGALRPFDGNAQFRQYAGTIISVADGGLKASLIPIPPLNFVTHSLFLPFGEMALERASWALWPEPYALRMTTLPDIDIILSRDAVQWIRSETDARPFGWET